MKKQIHIKHVVATLLTSVSSVAFLSAQINSCVPCGTGSDGAFTASANTTLVGGTYNYTTFTINSGVTVSITGTQPLVIRCSGAVFINGILEANGGNGANGVTYVSGGIGGVGVAGGQNGGNGTYSTSLGGMLAQNGFGAGGSNNAGNAWSGGGGAGYSAVGSSSGNSGGGFGGPIYGDAQLSAVLGGSGGGGGSGGFSCGSGGGGAGGGYIEISSCVSITIGATGLVRCNGGNGGSDGTGNCGGGGGGSGGAVWLASPTVINNGGIRALAGTGGASSVAGPPYYGTGANGALGRIRIDGSFSGSGSLIPATFYASSPLVVTASSNQTICAGNSVTMTASSIGGNGSPTYVWNPGNIAGNSATVSPTTTTTYVVTATDINGCTSTSSVTVTVNPLPVVTLSGSNTLCSNDSVVLTGSSGGTSQWYLNGVAISNATNNTYTATASGVYNMIKTNVSGCSDSATTGITVVGVAAPIVALGNNITQCGGTVVLDAQNAGSTFLWNTAATTQNITVNASGTFDVTVTNANGCEASDTISVVINALPVVTFSLADTLCVVDGPSTLTGNPSGGTFSGPGVNGNQFEPATAGVGMHVVTYTYIDSNACTASVMDSVLVDICLGNMVPVATNVFTMYPNPSHGNISLQTSVSGTLEIFDVLGAKVYANTIKAGQVQQIELSNQAAGVYLVRLTHAQGTSMDRLVIE
jgi:hypothetical protein